MITPLLVISVAIKSLTTAAIVLVSSFVARRSGPFWGAVTASLPVSVGPAYFFLALQHDLEFLKVTALNSAVACAGSAAFLCTFALLSNRHIVLSFGLSTMSWIVVVSIARLADWDPILVLLLNLMGYGLAIWVVRRLPLATSPQRKQPPPSWSETFVQAMFIAVFVAALVLSSQALGPELSGFAAVFPVSLASLIILSHTNIGPSVAAAIAPAALRVMPSYPLALVAIHVTMEPLGLFPALSLGLITIILWSIGIAIHFARKAPNPPERFAPTHKPVDTT